MTKTIYFHIGTVKTGTTFIQKFCYDNRDYLASKDIAYPYVTPPALHLPRYANAAFLWDESYYLPARRHLREIAQSKILISEEGLMGIPTLLSLPIFEDFEKKVILYIRPPASLITAWATERCKPYNAAVAELSSAAQLVPFEWGLSTMLHDYETCMARVMQELDKMSDQNVLVRPFESSQFVKRSLLHDFFAQLGLDLPFYEPSAFNASPTRKFCDISFMVWSCLNELDVQDFYDYRLVKHVYDACTSGDDRPVMETLPDSTIEELSRRLQYVEDHFSKRYLGGRPFFHVRLPEVHGRERPNYDPPDEIEVTRLTRLAINGRVTRATN